MVLNEEQWIKELREKRIAYGISQGRLAVASGITREYLNKIESGKMKPSKELLKTLHKELARFNPEVPLTMLFDYVKIRFPTLDIQHIIKDILKLNINYIMAYIQEGFAAHEASILEDVRVAMEKKKSKLFTVEDKILGQRIEILQLSIRPYNCLKRHGIDTVHELLRLMLREDWNTQCRNLGRKGAQEVVESLLKLGIVDAEYPGCRRFVTDKREAEKLCLTEQEWERVLDYFS